MGGGGGAATTSSSAVVTAVNVKRGQKVTRGQVLARLDQTSANFALQSAQRSYEAAVAAQDDPATTTRNGETTVAVYRPGREPERRAVQTGAHTEERTVITQGLAAGERILLEAP